MKDLSFLLGELTFLPNAVPRKVQSSELGYYICSFWQGNMPEPTRIE
jgi:hypothetical protein